jgi:hypothetical protein
MIVSPAASHTGQATGSDGLTRHAAMRCKATPIFSAGSTDDTAETLR